MENELHGGLMPSRMTLEGNLVRIVPFVSEVHCPELWAEIEGHDELFEYMLHGPFPHYDKFIQWTLSREPLNDPMTFAIIDKTTNRIKGMFCYMEIRPVDGVIELGSIIFAPSLQRTRSATESVFLMIQYAFDVLGYRRFEWKCNNVNAKSRQAALRFGFTFEAVFRQHRISKGKNRDTAWFSITDGEWPVRREAFVQWLDDSNFDEQGAQKRSLSDIRASL